MRFGVLGPLELRDGCGRLVRLGAPKQRTLMTVLLLHANQPVAVDRLMEALWPERPPRRAVGALRTYVSALRQAVGLERQADGSWIAGMPGAYQLTLRAEDLDLKVFERCAGQGQQAVADGEVELAAERFQDALRLWRGRPLEDVSVPAMLDGELAGLEERRLVVLEAWTEAWLALGRHAELLPDLRRLVALEPLRERLWAQWMLALYRSGRQADALDAYHELRRRLVDELGLEPGPLLQGLQQQILRGDPALHPPRQGGGKAAAARATAVASRAAIPRQLPPDVASFTGRQDELAELQALLIGSGGQPVRPVVISSIDGIGGIGKSALAIHAAHRLAARFPNGCLYVNLQGATAGLAPLEPLEVLGRFLRALGLPGQDVPDEVNEAAARFRSLLADQRLLVVLDNARDAAQVAPLLPASPGCAVLVTSRRVLTGLDGARHLHLDVLTAQEAVTLLGELAGGGRVATEQGAAREVARSCGFLPLAVRIAGARLAARPGWPVRALADRLANARYRLDELALADLGVRTSFQVSYQQLEDSGDALDQVAAGAFGLLGMLDGPDISTAAAARLLDSAQAETERVLERLVDAQLLETASPGRYRMHDLLRLYAREHATSQYTDSDRTAALARVVHFYVASTWHTFRLLRSGDHRSLRADPRWTQGGLRFPDATAALAWLEVERANLVAAVQQAATTTELPGGIAIQLSQALYGFFWTHNYWQDYTQVTQTALEVGRRTGDHAAQAWACNDLAGVHWRQGRYDEARALLQESLAEFRTLGDHLSQAAALGNLGLVLHSLDRHDEAVAHTQESLIIRRELGDRYGQAISLDALGLLHQFQGRFERALACITEGLTIRQELGDRQGQGLSLNNLGIVHRGQGKYDQALAYHRQSLAIFQELDDRNGQAEAFLSLADLHQQQGRHDQAAAYYQQGMTLLRELGARPSPL